MALARAQVDALAAAIAAVDPAAGPADAQLSRFFRAHPALGARDRGLVAEGVFAWLRRRRSLEAVAGTGPRQLALAVLGRAFGHSARELEAACTAREREWIAQARAAALPADPAVACDVPDWLWDRLGAALGPIEREALARAWLAPAPLDLRVNPMRSTREAVRERLARDGIACAPTPFSPLGLRLEGKPALQRHPLFLDGTVEVQDEGSQLVGLLVAPRRHDMVVDFCAGAGGKTLLLGALMRSHGRLYAFDTSAKRLDRLGPRLKRSGLSNVHPVLLAHERDAHVKRLAGKIDRVLVDAPCSGLGTARRNPDLKWRMDPPAIAELVAKQARILDAAATLVRPGGRLVYATCSVLPEENEDIVAAQLGRSAGWRLEPAAGALAAAGVALDTGDYLRVGPHRHGCDGFFGAILVREA